MINFTSGTANILAACKAAEVRTVLTSRAFVEQAKLAAVVEEVGRSVDIVWLDDVRAGIGLKDKLLGALRKGSPRVARKADDRAVILFTSGSEGTPKGVVLSHRNILANAAQAASRIDFHAGDKVFNVLPIFHSFGLTAGTVLPLMSGVPVYFYPSPLHYRLVPELVYGSNATIIFGTDTFLAGYARTAHPYDFRSVRYCFSGAEPVKASTRQVYMEKFGLRILEGYGVTEAAPVISINTPMYNRSGTVGKIMPGMDYRLEPVPGVDAGGRLHIRGPNIMMGYLRADNPGVLEPLADGWHDTGDIVAVDDAGFVAIRGRAKRFAKIGGEMISLAAVEMLADELWKGSMSAVVSVPDRAQGREADPCHRCRQRHPRRIAGVCQEPRRGGAHGAGRGPRRREACRCWDRARSTLSRSRKWCAAKISPTRAPRRPDGCYPCLKGCRAPLATRCPPPTSSSTSRAGASPILRIALGISRSSRCKAGAPLRRVRHRHRLDQAPGIGVARIGKDLVARAHLDDLAEIHDGDAVGDVFDHRHVVRDEEIGDAELALQFLEQLQHARLHRHVERRHAFVGDDQLWPQGQRPGDADALALAAREFVRIVAPSGRPTGRRAGTTPRRARGAPRASRCHGSAAARQRDRRPACADRARRRDPGRSSARRGEPPCAPRGRARRDCARRSRCRRRRAPGRPAPWPLSTCRSRIRRPAPASRLVRSRSSRLRRRGRDGSPGRRSRRACRSVR